MSDGCALCVAGAARVSPDEGEVLTLLGTLAAITEMAKLKERTGDE